LKLEQDFEDSVGYWVHMAARGFERALNEELAPHGVTYRQWQVLAWLALEEELTQSQIAERLRVEAPTLVGILDRMERDGWIRRDPVPGDRRKKVIRPTPRVEPVWRNILACARRVRRRATRGLEPAEIDIVKDVLSRIQRNLKTRRRVGATVA
jgi:MarR family transcriptional regulator for hemolysin